MCMQASSFAGKAALIIAARDITHGGKNGQMSLTEATECANLPLVLRHAHVGPLGACQ